MSNVEQNTENLLINFHPVIRQHIKELLLNGNVGLNNITYYDITPLESKYYTHDERDNFSYHFNCKVPYAGKKLPWVVIFNPERLGFAPDFDFNDDNFVDDDIQLVVENVPALCEWDVKNSKGLGLVLQQFLNLYKHWQLKKLQEDNMYARIFAEVKYYNCDKAYSLDDLEVLVDGTSVHFLVRIRVDCSELPEYLQNSVEELKNPGEDAALLKVSYAKLDASRVNTCLYLSPRLEQVLGNAKTLHIPHYSKDSILTSYISSVKKLLTDLIKQVQDSFQFRKTFIIYLIPLKKASVIEYDGHAFKKVVLLFDIDDYYCLVHVGLGNRFPAERPTIKLYSVYCIDLRKPCFRELTDFPYSPRWTPEQLAENMFNYLYDAILDFQNHEH